MGCQPVKKIYQVKPQFKTIYDKLKNETLNNENIIKESIKLSLSTDGLELNKFLRWISDNGKVSVVAESNLDRKMVVLDVVDQPVSEILGVVARRLGVQVTRSGNLYFLGTLKPEDRGVYVRKVTRLDFDEVYRAVSVLLSEHGRCVTYPDGLCIVGDRVEVINKIDELLTSIQSVPSDSWVVQFYLVSLSDGHQLDLGVDLSGSLDFAYSLNTGSNLLKSGLISSLIKADKTSNYISIIAQPLMIVLDGKSSKFTNGSILRLPQRTVSDQGTVTTTGYETIKIGMDITTFIRDLGSGQATIKFSLAMSQLTNYIDLIPVISSDTFSTEASINSGGLYLLGSLDINHVSSRETSFFNSYKVAEDDKRTIQIYVKAYKIHGDHL